MCHQSVGLIARHVEAAGIPTLCMGSARDILSTVNPPRAVFLDYPLGHTAGPVDRPGIQKQILKQTLGALIRIKTPGTLETLHISWPDNPDWENAFDMLKDDRTERVEVPQYQNEEDRIRAEAREKVIQTQTYFK